MTEFHASTALSRVKPSPTVTLTGRAQELARQGHDIIALTAGEPDFDTPRHIRAAGLRAISTGQTRYTAVDGLHALKDAICRKFARENGLRFEPDQISVGSGGKQVLFNALMATLDPGDEVIMSAPYWVSYPDIVRLAGAEPVILPCPQSAGFKLAPEALQAAIGPKTRWVILNSPSNPTGAVYSRDELMALAEILRAAPHVWVLSDDIYEHLLYESRRFHTLAQLAPDLADRILTLNGVSKAYAMTGWRIGYGAGPRALIRAMAKLQSQSTSNPCTISQHAAIAALDGPQDILQNAMEVFARRREMVVARLNRCAGISCAQPDGAFYVFPSVEGLIGGTSAAGRRLESDEDVAAALLDETGVATVFGAAFGLSPHLRLSFAASDEALTAAMDRIESFCAGVVH